MLIKDWHGDRGAHVRAQTRPPAMTLRPSLSRSTLRSRGFTLVEIMIVVVIIGVLAAIAIPGFQRIQTRSKISAFANDLRIGRDGIETYALENGAWPPDGASGVPFEVDGYVNRATFNGNTPLGGTWDWDVGVFGYTAGLSVRNPTADQATMRLVDQHVDDGNLSTGNFRSRSGGYTYILEF